MHSDRVVPRTGTCLAVLLCACFDPIPSDTLTSPSPTAVGGAVIDHCTLGAIADARVEVCRECTAEDTSPHSRYTGHDGSFLFKLDRGKWKINVTRESYSSSQWTVALAGERSLSLRLALSRRVAPPTSLKLDVLFVVDNSSGMAPKQESLVAAFPRFFSVLTTYEPTLDSRLQADLRIGVISTDMGDGGFLQASCEAPGDGGQLMASGCALPPQERFIRAVTSNGNVVVEKSNIVYEGKDADREVTKVFGCLARLGSSGCGFEQPLSALLRAVEPGTNDFLRPDAALAVILLTDGDDCSAVDPSSLFDPSRLSFGPPGSYRCFRHGVTCANVEGIDVPGVKGGCTPAGPHLLDLDTVADRLRALRKNQLYFAVIAGPREPVEVTVKDSGLALRPSCTSGTATPAIRLSSLVDGLFPYSSFDSICASDLGDTLVGIATRIITTTVLNPCH